MAKPFLQAMRWGPGKPICSPSSVSTAKWASVSAALAAAPPRVTRSKNSSSARRASGESPTRVQAVTSGSLIQRSAFSRCRALSSGTSRTFSPSQPWAMSVLTSGTVDPHLLEEPPRRFAVQGVENPEEVAGVDADVARHLGIVAEVVGDILPDAVEVDPHQLAAAVQDRAAGIAAGGVGIGQEVDRHVVETRIGPAALRGLRGGAEQLGRGVERLLSGMLLGHPGDGR